MNKFILILLIAVAFCVKIEFDGSSLENWWNDLVKTVLKAIGSYPSDPEKIKDWINNDEEGKQFTNFVTKNGGSKSIEICTKIIKNEKFCTNVINRILMFIS